MQILLNEANTEIQALRSQGKYCTLRYIILSYIVSKLCLQYAGYHDIINRKIELEKENKYSIKYSMRIITTQSST